MSTTVAWNTFPDEVNVGVTTSFLPLTTTYPSVSGCASSFIKIVPTVLAVWDPGLGFFGAEPDNSCNPTQVTSWWDEEHSTEVDGARTKYSIGPVVCPEGFTTAQTSVNAGSSTFVGCCPSNFQFSKFFAAGDTGECVSRVTEGQMIAYATLPPNATRWVAKTETFAADTVAVAVPVNGWLLPRDKQFITSSSTTTATSTGQSSDDTAQSGLSTGAKIGLGLGIPLAVLLLGAIGLGMFLFLRKRARRQQAAGRGGSGSGSGYYGPGGGGAHSPPGKHSAIPVSISESPTPIAAGGPGPYAPPPPPPQQMDYQHDPSSHSNNGAQIPLTAYPVTTSTAADPNAVGNSFYSNKLSDAAASYPIELESPPTPVHEMPNSVAEEVQRRSELPAQSAHVSEQEPKSRRL